MQRWERRLKDLGIHLQTCSGNYFDPDLFRMNANTFLTTARTVTFLIQKEKANIPDFENWYRQAVIKPWGCEPIMTWAKESRNTIEKEGDLDQHSELSITLIFTHDENDDIRIPHNKQDLVCSNISKLLHFAELKLPEWVSEDAVVKVERRWIADSLPHVELLQAFVFIYAQHYKVCKSLLNYLSLEMDHNIHDPSDFNEFILGKKRVTYLKYADRRTAHLKTIRQKIDPDFRPPAELKAMIFSSSQREKPKTLQENVNQFSEFAKGVFEHFGNHIPMLTLFDDDFRPIDGSSVMLDDRATKYLYWRSVADKIAYLGASSIIWVCEYWLRRGDMVQNPAWKELPITGEGLQIIGLHKSGEIIETHWNIARDNTGKAYLLPSESKQTDITQTPNFLMPVINAFKRIQQKTTN